MQGARLRDNWGSIAVLAVIGAVALWAVGFAQSSGRDPFAPLPADQQIDLADRDRVERIANGVVDRRFDILEQLLLARVEDRLIDRSETLRADLAEEILRLERSVLGDVGLAEADGRTLLERLDVLEQRLDALTAEMVLGPDGLPLAPGGTVSAPKIDLSGDEYEFVACVNGQPLLRASNGATFYAEEFQLAPGQMLCGS